MRLSATAQHAFVRVALGGSHRREGPVYGARRATGLCTRNPNAAKSQRGGQNTAASGDGRLLAPRNLNVDRRAGKGPSVWRGGTNGGMRTRPAANPGYVKLTQAKRRVAFYALVLMLTAGVSGLNCYEILMEVGHSQSKVVVHMQSTNEHVSATDTAQHAFVRVALGGSHRPHGTVYGARLATGLCTRNPNAAQSQRGGQGQLLLTGSEPTRDAGESI